MRPQKLNYLTDKAIQSRINRLDSSELVKLLPELKKLWLKFSKDEDDYRTGFETYGYNDIESIENNLMYISDRWRCAFRLKWLIDGIELGHI